jgi:ABC-type antimicrobial peptide transport system permease subunit
VAVFIIFIVAIVIINNSLVMSTLERTREIGTMRAIGAQRSFIMQMFLVETGVLSLIFGGLGAALGAGLMFILETTGIPAWDRITVFLFAGPRLYPSLMVHHLVIAMGVIVTVGLASTLYPARLATRIAPIVAMQDDD